MIRSPHAVRRAVLTCCTAVMAAGCGGDSASTAPPTEHRVPGSPEGWGASGGSSFEIGLDYTTVHGGQAAAYFLNENSAEDRPAIVVQSIRADNYRGKRVRWSGWVRQTDLAGDRIGLWMRVDGPGEVASFDDMSDRPLAGTSDWHLISVVLDIPENAIGIALGVLMHGTGTLLFDDLQLEVVGTDVPSTNQLDAPQPASSDSATIADSYARMPLAPVNLDFEDVFTEEAVQRASDWLKAHATVLGTTDPGAGLDDLQPLEQMIGSAHLVGLGEGTHGAREFFRMKHRILEFLVKRMGFTTFAMEATAPESNDVNRYVLTGEGDPEVLLSHLYFWTWNTQEVLDMIEWMREWNSTAAPSQQVRFLGFDMQYPGAAMDSVEAFVARVDSANSSFVGQRYACLGAYRNDGRSYRAVPSDYAALDAETKTACATALREVHDLLAEQRASYEAASSAAVYEARLHDARLVQQFEAMAAVTGTSAASASRDSSMAENIEWIRDQAGPDARIVLWAHNGHVRSATGRMGGHLRAAYGSDYVNLGFLFARGGFNAAESVGGAVQTWTVNDVPPTSIEAIFAGTGEQRLLFDARQIPAGGDAAALLRGPIDMRSIGSVYSPSAPSGYFSAHWFPGDFDLLLYLDTTTPSTLLPYRNS